MKVIKLKAKNLTSENYQYLYIVINKISAFYWCKDKSETAIYTQDGEIWYADCGADYLHDVIQGHLD